MESLGIDISPKTKIKELSTAQQQMVAITRALAFDAEIIIMDEPTSAITDREVEQLFKIIRKLKAQGKAIVYISHKMDEIYSLTDQITVFQRWMSHRFCCNQRCNTGKTDQYDGWTRTE